MPSTQKKIRDLERALRKRSADDPSAEGMREALLKLKEERVRIAQSHREKKMSQKYHMVKFFERRKLTRRYCKLERQLDSNESEALKEKMKKVEEDLAYVLYYPKHMKYISLFNQKEDSSGRSERARAMAVEARKQSIAEGEQDRVAHALDVERQGGGGNKRRRRKAENIDSDESGDSDSHEEDQSHFDNDGDDSDTDNDSSNNEADDGESDSDSESSSDEVDATDALERKTEVPADSDSEPTSDSDGAMSPRPTEVISSGGDEYEPDSFFLEEGGEDDTNVVDSEVTSSNHNMFNPGRRGAGKVRGRGGPMHKQEARLLKWQSGHRGRGRRGGTAGRGGEREKQGDAAFPNRGRAVGDTSRGGRVDGARGRGSRTDGNRGRGGRIDNARGRGGRARSTEAGSSSGQRSAWEEAGGVSALNASGTMKQKLSGAIVQSAGKKVKFE